MIIDAFFNFINVLTNFIVGLLPTVDFTINDSFIPYLLNIVKSSVYFIPIAGLLPIVIIELTLDGVNLVWKLILRVKSFIPTMGD